MKLFNNNIVPYASTEGDKIYPIVVDIKKGIKSGEAISFVTADNQVGVITVDFMDGNSSYSIEGCMVTSTIRRPDGTVLEIPCDIISQSTIEIPLGINGTYQEGTHTFDLKIVRGNGKVIGVPTMSYSVSGSLSSDDVVEGDDRLPVLTMVLDNAQDKLTRLDKAIAGATNDLEVKEARDGEVTLNARLERDLEKGKIHFVDIEGSNIATESQEGYLENVEIYGNTWQDANNLSDIRSVGTKVEGQELYKIDVVSCGKNLLEQVNHSISGGDRLYCEVNLNKNTDYIISCNKNIFEHRVMLCDKQLDSQGRPIEIKQLNYQNLKTFNTESNYGKLYILFHFGNAYEYYKNNDVKIQLEEGTVATPYEPYQGDKLTILSPTPLEKVGDVADRIVCKYGVWGVEKNVATKVLDGSEGNWYGVVVGDYFRGTLINFNVSARQAGMCDKLKINSQWDAQEKGIFIDHNLTITLPLSEANSFETFNQWLKTNLPVIKYENTTEKFIPLPHDQQIKLRTFANKTHITFDTEIQPILKAQVPKSLGATVNTHTTQIDNLNKELDRVKKLEKSTVSTVTSDKAFTTVAETTQGYFEDVKIEGKTLVNLYENKQKSFHSDYILSASERVNLDLFVEGKTYTAIIHTTLPHFRSFRISTGNINYDLVPPTLGNIAKFVYSPPKEGQDRNDVRAYCYRKTNEAFVPGDENKIFVAILEGDHTDKDIGFFEGLKSVGQNVEEVNIESINKNLIDMNADNWEKGSIANATGENITTETRIRMKHFGRLSQNVNYLSFKYFGEYKLAIRFYDMNFKGIDCSNTDYTSFVATSKIEIPNNAVYYRLVCAKNSEELIEPSEIANCMCCVELNDVAIMSYIEPKQDKKQILYFNPTTQTWEKPVLREWDSIEKHSDGKYYYHKRSGEIVLNGSEGWIINTGTPNQENTYAYRCNFKQVKFSSELICDKFVYNKNLIKDDIECINSFGTEGFQIMIRLDKSKDNLTTWLQANPVSVVYQLAQEEIYECSNLDLITYSGETNLIVNSGVIQPRLELKVLSNVSNVVKLLQEKVSVLENKFIEGLKQVLSGNMMALAQLLYPEDFENNHEIQTLEL